LIEVIPISTDSWRPFCTGRAKTPSLSDSSYFCTAVSARSSANSLRGHGFHFAPWTGVPLRRAKLPAFCPASRVGGSTNPQYGAPRSAQNGPNLLPPLRANCRPRGVDTILVVNEQAHDGRIDHSTSAGRFQQRFLAATGAGHELVATAKFK